MKKEKVTPKEVKDKLDKKLNDKIVRK